MVGSTGERMLSITLPHVDSWNAWYDWTGNRPETYRPLRDKIDAACSAAGRDPAGVERTVAVLVQLEGGAGRSQGDPAVVAPPLKGSPREMAESLRGFAREGVAHVQLVLDPIGESSIEALAPMLEELERY